MKKNLFLLLIFTLSVMSMVGQNKPIIKKNTTLEKWESYQKFNQEQSEEVRVVKQALDSVVSKGNPLFYDIVIKNYYTYNSFGKVLKSESYAKMPNESVLTKKKENTFTYNSEKLLTKQVEKKLIFSGEFENSEKYEYTYNGRLLAQKLKYVWNNNAWVNDKKTDYETNAQGHLTKETTAIWLNNAWVNDEKIEYVLDAQGYVVEVVEMKWIMDAWLNSSKTITTYQDNHVILSTVGMVWQEEWVNSSKSEYVYEAENPIKIIDYIWKENNWEKESYVKFLYENGVVSEMFFYKWEDDSWGEEMKIVFGLDLTTPVSDLVYPSDMTGDNYENMLIAFKVKMNKLEMYQIIEGQELLMQTSDYYWNNKDVDDDGIAENQLLKSMIYPNPVTDVMSIKIEDKEFEGTLEIIHLYNGKTVYNGKFVKE